MKNTMNERNWITRAAAKVKHFHGRDYCGYLTPSEVIGLYDAKFIRQTPTASPHYMDWVRARRDQGNSVPNWHYFQLVKDTPFAEAVAARIKVKRG